MAKKVKKEQSIPKFTKEETLEWIDNIREEYPGKKQQDKLAELFVLFYKSQVKYEYSSLEWNGVYHCIFRARFGID